MNYTIYGIWRSSSHRAHIKDTQIGERFEDWYYGNADEHSYPMVWTDINNVYGVVDKLTRDHIKFGFIYQVKEFSS